MQISSKCTYALRALYALAEEPGPGPLKIAEIAGRQKIPLKFLETILNQLKGGGFVRSQRGAEGGYRLARPADRITVVGKGSIPIHWSREHLKPAAIPGPGLPG